jgi:transcriptional regulator with XRE-family HTH domain
MVRRLAHMILRELLQERGVRTLTELAKRLGIRKQYAWLLWHGSIALSLEMAKRLHEEIGIPLDQLIQVERREPAKKRGRKRKED